MSTSKKKAEKSEKSKEKKKDEKDESQPAVDEGAERVHNTIVSFGADAYGTKYPTSHGPTMRALLHQYTQSHTLTEIDEDGEHPLIPQSRSRGRGEQRPGHASSSGDAHATAAESELSAKEQAMISKLLRKIDTDKLTHVKELFSQKDNALNSKDFVDVLFANVRNMEGGEDRLLTALELLHTKLTEKPGEEEGEEEAVEDKAFITESGVASEDDGSKGLVTWEMFAELLLREGVVADVVNSFNIAQVLSLIEVDKIAPLKETFEKKGSVNLEEFVIIMKSQFQQVFQLTSLFHLDQDERNLIAQLINLFEMIDVPGKGSMTWEEFSAFLVDQGMAEDVPQQYNTIRFQPSGLQDCNGHQSHCEKAVYFKGYDKIAFVEQGSKVLKMCTPDMQPYTELKDFTQTPLCAEYIDKYSCVVVSCSDLTLSFFDVDNNLKLGRRIETKTAQLVLCWSEVAQVLFSADHEGRILAWDLNLVRAGLARTYEVGQGDPWRDFVKVEIGKDPPMRHIDTDSQRQELAGSHQGQRKSKASKGQATSRHSNGQTIVMMLLELPVLQQMASCGVDRNVMTWDVFTGNWKRTLRGHEMGVRCMAFATSTKVLVTGGFDYNLFVWNPYVGNSIHTITGHTAPIVGIEVLGSTSNQVVSADQDGFLKTWDLGTYQLIQALSIDEIMTLRAFISIPSWKRVIAVEREFIAWDYQNTGAPDQTEEEPLIKVFYHERLKVFVSGCINHVKIWDAVTGAIKVVINHTDAEITDFCFDDRGRKIFISDHCGEIYVYHASTGCLVKKMTHHSKEVSGLMYCDGDKNIISVSWDRSIAVHDESDYAPVVHRRSTNAHGGDITCVAYSRHLGMIATGSTDCVIAVREYLRLRILSSLLGHKTDITAIAFVDPYPLLVSADFSGNVAIWALPSITGRPHRLANSVLTRFINMQSLESSASVNCLDPVCEMKDGQRSLVLYTGDEDGDVRAWDVTALLTAADIEPCPTIPDSEWDPVKRVENDASHTAKTMARKAASLDVPELQVQVDHPVVRQGISWKAHSDSMRSLKVYKDPSCIVTAGYDGMAKIWTRDGQLMTVLRAYGQTPWHFPVQDNDPGVPAETLDYILKKVQEADKKPAPEIMPRFSMPGFALSEIAKNDPGASEQIIKTAHTKRQKS
eukprot:TRINITY_DN11136_c0_g2_i1.p1 TRINITY_DN11136_c0_g2~~TRINITY_DN11136_c0_g2_i1.p1  ORF type:complete len:1153 (+),score=285.20 TRINITY_DN11136_c0_g2_i1:92-3550(+)